MEKPAGYNEASERASEHLESLVSSQHIPGIQYVVVDADSVLFKYAAGVCDVKTKEKVTHDTLFLSSSCTKVVTAAAVLKLMEAGKVNLQDPLSKYCGHSYGDNLRVQHLLNQSSGIPNPMPLNWLHTAEEHPTYSEPEALETTLKAYPMLTFEPGTKYAYSNLSYWLLGKVIEKASGMTYKNYLQREVFDPLGICDYELTTESPQRNLARGHAHRFSVLALVLGFFMPHKLWDTSVGKWARFEVQYMNGPAYGGLFATAMGYARFLQDMIREEPKIFSKTTREMFFSEQRDASGNLMPTILGWHRGELRSAQDMGEVYFGKPGGGPGFHSNLRVYPGLGLATVFLANKMQVSEGPINTLSDTLDRVFIAKQTSS